MSDYDDHDLSRAATRGRAADRTTRLLEELTASAAQPRHVMVYGDDDLLSLDETLATPPPADAPLRRYLAYQARDFVKQRGVWIGLLGLAGLYLFWYNYDPAQVAEAFASARTAGGDPGIGGARTEAAAFGRFSLLLAMAVAGIGALLGTHGIVSQERERGHQRFLFAKPIPLVPYYLQKLGVAIVGSLAVVATITLLTGLVFQRGVPLDEALGIGALLTIVLGSLTFLLSTLVRFEGAAALALAFAVFPLRAAATRPGWEWLEAFRFVLPPMDRIAMLAADVGAVGTTATVAWALAYAAACVAGGIAVLRRRSILT